MPIKLIGNLMTESRSIVIVGASSSIGDAVVARFGANGDEVLATYHRGRPGAATTGVRWAPLDVTAAGSRDDLATAVAGAGRSLDVVLLLAGLLPGQDLGEYTPDLAQRVLDVNFTGQALLLQALLPHLGDGSQVIMMASVSAQRGSYDPFYAAAKGAVLPFVKSLARALAPRTRVNAIAPALIEDTAMYTDMAPEVRDRHRAQTPTGALVQIDDLAHQIFDLTQPHWRALNGACIDLNGGGYLR